MYVSMYVKLAHNIYFTPLFLLKKYFIYIYIYIYLYIYIKTKIST